MSEERSEIDMLREDMENFRKQFVVPSIRELEDQVEDAMERIDELEEENERQKARIEQLDTQVENLIGVDNPDNSTHEKRVRDVRAAMIRRAEAQANKRSDQVEGKIALYYKEIQNLLADHGHGEVYDTQVRRIMDEIENVDGFTFGKKTSPDSGRKVKALRLNLAALPGYAGTNNVVSSSSKGGAESGQKHAITNNQS